MVQGLLIKLDAANTTIQLRENIHENKKAIRVCSPRKGENAINAPIAQELARTSIRDSFSIKLCKKRCIIFENFPL